MKKKPHKPSVPLPNKIKIGHGLAKIKAEKNITFENLAKNMGYNSKEAVANITQRDNTNTKLIDKLSEALGVTQLEFIEACLVDKEKDQ